MSRITERLSPLIKQQLPEFIRADYPLFVTFLEAYYKFIEQDQNAQEIIQNALSYNDIDRTAPSFINYFLKNYGNLLPNSFLGDKSLLIKRLNDLYVSKGSDLSFKLLFRILFNSSVTVKKPYDFVLRASDGEWVQPVSIRVNLLTGSAGDILNRNLQLTKNGITYTAAIYRVKNLSEGLYELFLKAKVIPAYEVNDLVFVSSSTGVIFTGNVEPTPTTYEIVSGGKGFKKNQIFTINLSGAVNTVVQITGVNGVGAITALKFINYGYGFTNVDISIDLYNNLEVASRTATFNTKTRSIIEDFEMVLVYLGTEPGRYFLEDYVEVGYNGDQLVKLINDPGIESSTTISTAASSEDAAVIIFKMGAVGRYPGQYLSNKGFISEPDVRLQDDKQYQPFAYLLESENDISTFYEIVKSLIHPAGTNMFNNRTLTATLDVKNDINITANLIATVEV